MNNYWDQNDDSAFRDGQDDDVVMPHEIPSAPRQYAQPRGVVVPKPAPVTDLEYTDDEIESLDDLINEVSEEENEDDYTDVLSDARLRLEQGRLYELLMNHNLFEGVQADIRAIKNVQREIRNYAKDRMEVMLGMKLPKEAAPQAAVVSSPFNELEVTVLKMIAKTASKGKTDQPPVPAREGLAPMAAPKPQQEATMRPMAQAKVIPPKPSPPPGGHKPKPIPPPSQKHLNDMRKNAKPLERKKADPKVDRILAEEGVTRDQLEENYKPLSKDPSQMTEEERLERNREIASRLRKQVSSPDAKPMPSYDQQLQHYTAQASEVASSGPMSLLLAAVSRKR